MTTMQIVSLVAVAAVAAFFYLPRLTWPKPSSIRHIESVMVIRESTTSPEVKEACTSLLQALLQ